MNITLVKALMDMMPRWSVRRSIRSVWFFALLSAVALSWTIGPRDFYTGGDGKWTQSLIRFYLTFVPPLQINALTPMQGDFSQSYPLDLWLNPSHIQFTFLPFQVAMLTSMLTFLAILALAVYACARELGMDRVPAAIAAQCAVWFFPPFSYFAGILPMYQLKPNDTLTLALFIFLLALLLKVGPDSSPRRIAVTGVAATALIGYIVYDEPMRMLLVAFCMGPCFAFAILAPLNIRGIAARLAVLVIPVGILGAIGFVQYVLALDYYTSRYVFRAEFPRVQIPDLASLLFFMKNGRITLAICAIGLLLGLIYTRGRPLVAVLMGAVTLAVVAIAGAIYLFSEFIWWPPLPIYMELYSLPLVFIGAVAGYFGFLQWLSARYSVRFLHTQERGRISTTVIAALVVPVAIVYVAVAKSSPTTEPYPDESAISELFAKELSIGSGSQWNGSVYLYQYDYRKQLTLFTLWKQQIPTLNEYDQTLSPFYYFMMNKIVKWRGWDTHGLAALGVRYLMLPGDQAILDLPQDNRDTANARIITAIGLKPRPRLHHIFLGAGQGYGDFAWLVYELSDPNHGQYTPTTVKLAYNAKEYQQLLTQPEFDWRQHVAMESDPGPLTIAEETKLYVEAGRVRVEAENAGGRSLALLPIQYSNCLKVSGTGNPQLVRSDLLLTGLLFSGESHIWIDFDLGFFGAGCRWSDIADMKRLKIPEAVEILSAERHPFAIKSISDIPLRMGQLDDGRDLVQRPGGRQGKVALRSIVEPGTRIGERRTKFDLELFGLMDCAVDLAQHYRTQLLERIDVDEAIDRLIYRPAHARYTVDVAGALRMMSALRVRVQQNGSAVDELIHDKQKLASAVEEHMRSLDTTKVLAARLGRRLASAPARLWRRYPRLGGQLGNCYWLQRPLGAFFTRLKKYDRGIARTRTGPSKAPAMTDGRNHWRVRHRSKVGEVRPGDEQQGAWTRKAPRERMDARHRFASRTFRHGTMTSSPLALLIGTAAPFAQFESGKDESWACSASPLPQMVRPTNSAEISSRRQPKSVPGAHPSARWSERAKGASAVHPEACGLWV